MFRQFKCLKISIKWKRSGVDIKCFAKCEACGAYLKKIESRLSLFQGVEKHPSVSFNI